MTPLQLTSQELASKRPQQFDSIVYINVLEHILDDAAEMRTAFDLVAPGGSLGVFVPAMSRLYGSLDYKSGHHRRYDKASSREVIAGAGFEIVELRYLEVAGVRALLADVPTARSAIAQLDVVGRVRPDGRFP